MSQGVLVVCGEVYDKLSNVVAGRYGVNLEVHIVETATRSSTSRAPQHAVVKAE